MLTPLLVAFILFLIPVAAHSAEQAVSSMNNIFLEPIIISAVRSSVAGGTMPENVFSYSAGKIRAMPVRDLGQVLARVPGVDMSVGSGMGQSTFVTIHGSNSRQVLVMVDDIPFNTQLSGQANPTKIPVENIKRVEVIKGASSSTWGSSLGGVVNVITKDVGTSETPQGSMTNSYGEFTTRKHSMDLAGRVKGAGYYFSESLMATSGTRTNSSLREERAFGKMALPFNDEVKLTTSLGYSGGDGKEPVPSYGQINKNFYMSRYGKIRLDLDKPDGANFNLAYKFNNQYAATDVYNAATLAHMPSWSSANRNLYQGIGLNGHIDLREDDVLVYGTDLEWDTIKSTNYLTESKSVSIQAPYANYTWRVGRWDIIPGMRFDNNDRFGNQLSPSMGSVYHFEEDGETQWRVKVSRAFNAPPLMWIYNSDPYWKVAPNLDLMAERAVVYETGMTLKIFEPLKMDVDVYRSDVQDGLVNVRNALPGGYTQYQNIGKLRRQGTEARLEYKVSSALKMYTDAGFNHAVNRVTHQIVRGNGTARQKFGWGLDYESPRGFGVDLYGYYARWDSSPGQSNDRKPIFDLKLTKRWKDFCKKFDLEAFVNVHNLTNSKYWTHPDKPLAERYFEGGTTLFF